MIKKRILYAEDEFTNRKLVEIKLKKAGISCDLAQDGLKAIEMFNKHTYHLVILDQYMPGLNGDEVAIEIRKNNKDVPMIAVTSDDNEMTKLKDAGFNQIFIKPLRGNVFIETISDYLK